MRGVLLRSPCPTSERLRRLSKTPARDDEEARVEASPPGECAAVARAAAHVARAAMRAITHVVGKAIGSSRRARRGAGCWFRTTIGASGRAPISSSRIALRRRRRPVVLSMRAHARMRPVIRGDGPDRQRRDLDEAGSHPVAGRDVQRSATLGFLRRWGTTALGAMFSEDAPAFSPTWVSSSTAFGPVVALVSTRPQRLAMPDAGWERGVRPITTCSLAWISQFRPPFANLRSRGRLGGLRRGRLGLTG